MDWNRAAGCVAFVVSAAVALWLVLIVARAIGAWR